MTEDGGTGDGGDGGSGDGGGYTPPASQADLDRIIADRVNRTKAQFRDYADLKSKAAEFDRLSEAQKTEAQKASDRATAAEERAAAATQRAVRAEVKAIASGEFADPDDAAAFLDLAKYVNDKGDVDAAAIEADLKDLLKRKPHLSSPTGRADVGLGARGGSPGTPTMNDLIRQAAGRR